MPADLSSLRRFFHFSYQIKFVFLRLILPSCALLICSLNSPAQDRLKPVLVGSGEDLPGITPALNMPPALEPWRGWVDYASPDPRCPSEWRVLTQRLANNDLNYQIQATCAWPGELNLAVDATEARFDAHWRLYSAGAVPLPGNARQWPIDVTANGAKLVVIANAYGIPTTYLEAGEYHIGGRIPWHERPESLTIPDTPLLRLRRDGQLSSPLEFDENGQLWLGAPLAQREQDRLDLSVARLIQDGQPQQVTTYLELWVSGQPREVSLGPVILPQHALLSLESELPARIEHDGRLSLQLRSGYWSVNIVSRALVEEQDYTTPQLPEPWPAQEFWSLAPEYSLRTLQLSGGALVDPEQTDLPLAFDTEVSEHYPVHVLKAGEHLHLEELHRGAQAPPTQIVVTRKAWLDYRGTSLVYRDVLSGETHQTQRIDLRPPFVMEYALLGPGERDEVQLITYRPDQSSPHQTGLEWRLTTLDLEARVRVPYQNPLPLSAWDVVLEQLEMQLYLPPGYQLLHADGFDQVPSSWVARWDLLDIFLSILAVALLWQWGRWPYALTGACLGLLASHQDFNPQLSLLVLTAFLLLRSWSSGERTTRYLQRFSAIAAFIFALQVLCFAFIQIESAIYPNLEPRVTDRPTYALYAPPAPVSARAVREQYSQDEDFSNAELDRVEVTGSRLSQIDLVTPYDPDAQRQAGRGQPRWSWHEYQLSRRGPIQPQEEQSLWISPPWLTRCSRLVMAVTALLLLFWLGRDLIHRRKAGKLRITNPLKHDHNRSSQTGMLLLITALSISVAPFQTVKADTIPSAEMLAELAQRLHPKPDCLPACVSISEMYLSADDQSLTLSAEVHSAIHTLLRLPVFADLEQWPQLVARLDGNSVPIQGSWQRGTLSLPLPVGRHQVELELANPGLPEWKIVFPVVPAHLLTQLNGWAISGLQGDRPQTNGITVYRQLPLETAARATAEIGTQPYLRVERRITLDLNSTVSVEVTRLDQSSGTAQFQLPLLDGEEFLSYLLEDEEHVVLNEGVQEFSLASGQKLSWNNRLSPRSHFEWQAPDLSQRSERWTILAAPVFHTRFNGAAYGFAGETSRGYNNYLFYPRPGETLSVDIQRPQAVPGISQALDEVSLLMRPGRHFADYRLLLTLTITQAGIYPFKLPPDATLLSVAVNQQDIPLPAVAGQINIPVNPQSREISVEWRQSIASQAWLSSPELQLGRPSTNLVTQIEWSGQRWLLWTQGPGQGPVVRFWSLLALLLLAAVVLARLPHSPLRFPHWLLLGIGFSTVNSWMFLWVVCFFFLLAYRGRHPLVRLSVWPARIQQLALACLGLLTLYVLIGTIMTGLLAQPDMLVANSIPLASFSQGGTSLSDLYWFTDSSDGVLPSNHVLSAPLWLYRLAMLLWALWFSLCCARWIRWAWDAFSHGGAWPKASSKDVPDNNKTQEGMAMTATEKPHD